MRPCERATRLSLRNKKTIFNSDTLIKMQKLFSALLIGSLGITACDSAKQIQKDQSPTAVDSTLGLKDYYDSYFPIGVAVSPRALKTDEAGLVVQHFNSLTPVIFFLYFLNNSKHILYFSICCCSLSGVKESFASSGLRCLASCSFG